MGSLNGGDCPAGMAVNASYAAVARGGVMMIGLSQAVRFVVQLAATVILARLIPPHAFGVFAMVMPVVSLVLMVQDFGLFQTVIAARGITHAQETSLFLFNTALALAMATLLALSAPLVAAFYHQPEVIAPTLALAATVVIAGAGALPFALLTRELRFATVALIDMAGAVAGVTASLVVALVEPDIRALVASVLANMSVGLICAWCASGWRPGRPAPLREVTMLLRAGGGIAGAGFWDFAGRNGDNILIGRYLGPVSLGFYDRAYRLLVFPLQQLTQPIHRVTIPILARLRDDPARYRSAYARMLDQILLVMTPAMVVLAIMADAVIGVAMGPRWAGSVPIFQWLGLAGLALPLTSTFSWLLVSQDRTRELLRWSVLNAVTCLAGFALGLRHGAVGVAALFAASELLLRTPAYIWFVGRHGPVGSTTILRVLAPHALAAGASTLAVILVERGGVGSPLVRLMTGGSLSYLVAWGLLYRLPGSRARFDELRSIRHRLTRRVASGI